MLSLFVSEEDGRKAVRIEVKISKASQNKRNVSLLLGQKKENQVGLVLLRPLSSWSSGFWEKHREQTVSHHKSQGYEEMRSLLLFLSSVSGSVARFINPNCKISFICIVFPPTAVCTYVYSYAHSVPE